jgi:hypothetical protein
MIAPARPVSPDFRAVFEQHYLPEITARSFAHFSRLDPAAREEAVQDCLASAYVTFLSASARGKRTLASRGAPSPGRNKRGRVTPGTLAQFANRSYDVGRRFTGSSNVDVLGERTRLNGRVNVVSLDDCPPQVDGLNDCTIREVLADRHAENTPAELAAWNIDWSTFYGSDLLNDRQRVVLDLLAAGYRTGEVAQTLCVSPARAVQLTDAVGEAAAQFFGPDIVPVPQPTGKPAKKRGRPRTSIYIPLSARAGVAAE